MSVGFFCAIAERLGEHAINGPGDTRVTAAVILTGRIFNFRRCSDVTRLRKISSEAAFHLLEESD